MKITSAIKLGHKNISLHKKSLIVFISLFSIAFSVATVFAINVFKSEKQVMDTYKNATDGKVMIKLSICDGSYQLFSNEKLCDSPETYDKIAREKVRKYHGEVIGAVIKYVSSINQETIYVVPEKAAKNLKAEPAYYAPDEKIPVIKSAGYKISLDNIFYNLGDFPKDGDEVYLVLDNTNRIQNYIFMHGYTVDYYSPLLIFDDIKDATDFYNHEANAKEIFTNFIKTQAEYKEEFTPIKFFFASLFAIMIVTITMLFILYSKKDDKLLALYFSLGATKQNIIAIYLMSAIEITIYISIISLVIGNIISFI